MKLMAIVVAAFLLLATEVQAIPKTCVMYYPKVCSPVIQNMQIVFNCPVEYRKFKTKFGLMDFFRAPYMPETMKFVPHDLDHFIWDCPE